MKKSILVLVACALSLTLFSFTSSATEDACSQTVELHPLGNYFANDVEFTQDDEAALEALEAQDPHPERAGWFFVRCERKCGCKFTRATIAGSGCAAHQVANPTAYEIQAANTVRAQVDEIMSHYMPR